MKINENIWSFIKILATALVLLLIGSIIHPLIGVFLFLLGISLMWWWLRKNKLQGNTTEDNKYVNMYNEKFKPIFSDIFVGIMIASFICIPSYFIVFIILLIYLFSIHGDPIFVFTMFFPSIFFPYVEFAQVIISVPLVIWLIRTKRPIVSIGVISGVLIIAAIYWVYYFPVLNNHS